MNSDIIADILKYVDCFGTSFSFYTEKSRKFYTRFGGILTLLSIIIDYYYLYTLIEMIFSIKFQTQQLQPPEKFIEI